MRRSSGANAAKVLFFTILIYFAHAFTSSISRVDPSLGLSRPSVTSCASCIQDDLNFDGVASEQSKLPTLLESGLVSSYHLLYPEMFRTVTTSFDQELPLYLCLRLLKRAIKSLIRRDGSQDLTFAQANMILRIEQKISHDVDPLCWLQAQKKLNMHRQYPSIYFATAEGTLEAAALGSSLTYAGLTDDNAYWDIVDNLPPSAHLYGGQRFDPDTSISEEWTSFSTGWWMLPAVELRTTRGDAERSTTTIAVHIARDKEGAFFHSAQHVLDIVSVLTDTATARTPPTTLPPILSRTSMYGTNLDGQEIYEKGVAAALEEFRRPRCNMKKVVLARRMDLSFASYATENVDALDVLRKWKFGSQPGGHTFYLHPGGSASGEFFGCTPERLFRVNDGSVLSEALAGTRPRGSTHESDTALSRQLFESTKDQAENLITGNFIRDSFREIRTQGYLQAPQNVNGTDSISGDFFVRRLRHLQHICQRYECLTAPNVKVADATRRLLAALHPTPAVGGFPKQQAMEFIREHESIGFDRGFYSGPVGFVGNESAELLVAIRSGLLTKRDDRPKLSVYAGAGIVPGSSVQGEWAETSYKLAVVSSIFPQSPITLQSAPTPNSAWATAFIEELIRNGVTQFYVCPGSRSTPIVAAIAKAVRSYVGVVQAVSIHDERGAAFRAVGYGRGCGRPAAVVTSSGTAVANLYPAIVEAGMDGIPMVVLTADRPYENRNTGANQAIDQVKIFSDSYVRWFRDFLPPSDDVPVSVALNDATHGVRLAKTLRGPVHFNVQFRENLAPEAGPIRNDDRISAVTRYDAVKFTDVPGFQRWSLGGSRWQHFHGQESDSKASAVSDIGNLISKSKRGLIVVGNIRKNSPEDISETIELISSFAERIGFPILTSALSAPLRFNCACVIPFAEHILRSPIVQENFQPDLILQLGSPLVSTEIPNIIKGAIREDVSHHVLVHPHHTIERADPEFTVSHDVDAEIGGFVRALVSFFDEDPYQYVGSALLPLVGLGRVVQGEIISITSEAAKEVRIDEGVDFGISEPELVLAMARSICNSHSSDMSLFLSNSMPVRDAEAFLYPVSDCEEHARTSRLKDTGVNRGASGIDGIIASATGFAEATNRPTTLLIGDVAALHDLNSLHALQSRHTAKDYQNRRMQALTTVVLNNDGGGIFSFLPISSHGADVAFEDFFGTPTHNFSFERAAQAFGLSYQKALDVESFRKQYFDAIKSEEPSIIEAIVATREQNVRVHKAITRRISNFVQSFIDCEEPPDEPNEALPVQIYGRSSLDNEANTKTLVMLHGWMGDKSEWNDVIAKTIRDIGEEWRIVSVDLPGHGDSKVQHTYTRHILRSCLHLNNSGKNEVFDFSIDTMAERVHNTLLNIGFTKIDALAGYSLGGRVALAMKRSSLLIPASDDIKCLLKESTKLLLFSTYPGDFRPEMELESARVERLRKDEDLATKITVLSEKSAYISSKSSKLSWSSLLDDWYGSPIWGSLKYHHQYDRLMTKRSDTLASRGRDLASVLRQCSPSLCRNDDWRGIEPLNTLFVVGSRDRKYTSIAEDWSGITPDLNVQIIPERGHALLVEAPDEVAKILCDFLGYRPRIGVGGRSIPTQQSTTVEASRSDMSSLSTEKSIASIEASHVLVSLATVASLDYEKFVVDFSDDRRRSQNVGVAGIGWGSKAKLRDVAKQRKGFIIQIMSADGVHVGIGEVSPLPGLHPESLEEAESQLYELTRRISDIQSDRSFSFDASTVFALDGVLRSCLYQFIEFLGVDALHASVSAGLEMALLSIASQVIHTPLHQAFAEASHLNNGAIKPEAFLALNGLITRGSVPEQIASEPVTPIRYESWKVKVGHQSAYDDAMAISYGYRMALSINKGEEGRIRADANRSFNETTAMNFVKILKGVDNDALKRLEYVEEPLEKQGPSWNLVHHISALERWYNVTGIQYSLDESILDLAEVYDHDVDAMKLDLQEILAEAKGCAALILKPSLLGLENSFRLARIAQAELGIGAVFTSSFDSGVGLAFAAFLANLSDATHASSGVKYYSHGLGTFSLLADDCISPSFGSYVNQDGKLNVASLSRAFYGLRLDELQCLSINPLPSLELSSQAPPKISNEDMLSNRANFESLDDFEASTATSSDGREINVLASLPLPFSAEVASARFTDLPQQPRWSPWISSVAYVDARSETEWTLRIRGVNFRWRAKSSLLEKPHLGICWESISGLKNTGAVEFIPTDNETCLMKVQIACVTPGILSPLFKGTSVFFEDFLRNKLLKWSLEMFRDVVKGDLALEEGNVELGDALFGAVEGKANAIEATFSNPIDKQMQE